MKHLVAFALLAFACGGTRFDVEEELDETEQELSAPVGPAQGYGNSTAGTRNRCNNSSSGQNCMVPSGDKTVTYCFAGAWPTADKNAVAAGVAQVDSALQFWTFANQGTCGNPATSEMIFNFGVSVGNGPTSNAMSAFSANTLTGTVATLTESVPGTWQSFTKMLVNVDNADINARSFSIYNHVGGYSSCIFTGLGSRGDTANSYCNRDVTVPGVSVSLTAGEVCKANNYSMSSPGTWAFSGTCSSD